MHFNIDGRRVLIAVASPIVSGLIFATVTWNYGLLNWATDPVPREVGAFVRPTMVLKSAQTEPLFSSENNASPMPQWLKLYADSYYGYSFGSAPGRAPTIQLSAFALPSFGTLDSGPELSRVEEALRRTPILGSPAAPPRAASTIEMPKNMGPIRLFVTSDSADSVLADTSSSAVSGALGAGAASVSLAGSVATPVTSRLPVRR